MPDSQFDLTLEKHWYSLVAASPLPESGEMVNVAVVFGNGRAYHLDFIKTLPRLGCLVPREQLAVYAGILESCKDRVGRGIDPTELSALLGPQLVLRPPRALYAQVSDALIARMRTRFLDSPGVQQRVGEEALIRKSRHQLDRSLRHVDFPQSLIARDVRPNKLYEGRLERLSTHRVPRLARALRGHGRDLLLDSVAIEKGYHARDIREVSTRITHAFFVYNRYLREAIRQYANVEVKIAGVLYALPQNAPAELVDLHELTRESWLQQRALVIEGTRDEVQSKLQVEADWVRVR